MSRRDMLLTLAAAPLVLASSGVRAQGAYPNKPAWVVVPWPAGAATDVVTRAIADALGRELGQPFQVDNRPGASGAIGSAYVAKARPDGYTLITATADTHSINPHVRADLPYDAVNDFVPLILFGTISWVWLGRADLPANDMKELVALARQQPGKISYGSWGIGSTAHVAGALLESGAGIQLNHIPHQGAAPAAVALQGGHIDLMPFGKPQAADLRAAGKVKILGVSSARRSPDVLSDVPTLAELGIPGAESGSWYGIMAPKGLPDDIRTKLVAALTKVVGSPEMVQRIRAAGMDPANLTGAALNDFLRREYERYGVVVRQKQIRTS